MTEGPVLVWSGKTAPIFQNLALKTIEVFGPSPNSRLIHGDCLEVSHALGLEGLNQKVDLIYLDPPFASGVDYSMEEHEVAATKTIPAFTDKWEGIEGYLSMIYPRLVALKDLLSKKGTIWVHVDWRANYLIRQLCDEIFGRDLFLNEIVWKRAPNLGRQAKSKQFGRNIDYLIVYGASSESRLYPPTRLTPVEKGIAKFDTERNKYFTLAPRGDYTDASISKLELDGRVYRSATGTVYIKYWLEPDSAGNICKPQPVDSLWTDIPSIRHVSPKERTGYPTQKPEALLKRVIEASTLPGDLVYDPFAGSGTTGIVAASLSRRFILADIGVPALKTASQRLKAKNIAFSYESTYEQTSQ